VVWALSKNREVVKTRTNYVTVPAADKVVLFTSRLTGGMFGLDGQVVDLQGRVGSVAGEADHMIHTVTDPSLLDSDSVVHHTDVVDRKHAPVNLTTS